MKLTLPPLAIIGYLFLSQWVAAQITFPNSAFKNLDYGLYWFDYQNAIKAEKGEDNPNYYNGSKTVIYIHGWQPGSVEDKTRETLHRERSGGPDKDLAHYWLNRGYNVGILYWNQFADEDEVKDAEAKIYSASGPQGMRWKSSSGSYSSGPKRSVTKLLYQSLVEGMPDFQGSELRITGHSLGNQLAIALSNKLNTAVNNKQLSSDYRPDRIALLDPFYSIGGKSYLKWQWTGDVSRARVETLKEQGVAIEAYRSSVVTSSFLAGDENRDLMNEVAFVQLKPWNFQAWQVEKKHSAAVTHYFWSRSFSARELYYNSTDVPSASSSSSVITKWMNSDKGLSQHNGAWTGTPKDDDFKTTSRL